VSTTCQSSVSPKERRNTTKLIPYLMKIAYLARVRDPPPGNTLMWLG
jgi:hypothetical protein